MTDFRKVMEWMTSDDTGISSKNIACHMVGISQYDPGFAPLDPSDLGRCLRLLELFPEWKPRIGEMAQHGKEWEALIPHWDELSKMMEEEVGIDWSKGKFAPKTYEAMHRYQAEADHD